MTEIEKLKQANKIMEKEIYLEKNFYSYDKELYLPKTSVDYDDKIAQNKVKIKVLEWFKTFSTDEYIYKFSKYIQFYLDATPRCGFDLTDEIEGTVYDKVWNSHSDLFVYTNRKVRELIEYYCDVETLEHLWTSLNGVRKYDIKDPDKYADDIIENLQEIINFLNSDTMKKLNVLIETYIDDMVKYGEEHEDDFYYQFN